MNEIFSEVISSHLRSENHLDTTKPFSEVVAQAALLLGNNESLVSTQAKSLKHIVCICTQLSRNTSLYIMCVSLSLFSTLK